MGWEEELSQALPRGSGHGDNRPNARWCRPEELGPEWDYGRDAVFLGYRFCEGRWKALGCRDDRHVFVAAGSRAGKGVSFVVPNLLLYNGPVLALDPKGELAATTAAPRARRGHKVVVLDPFDASTETTRALRGTFNPLLEIDPSSDTVVDDAALIAEALIVKSKNSSDTHWVEAASELVKGLILYALCQPPQDRTLNFVRQFFIADDELIEGPDGDQFFVSGQNGWFSRMRKITAFNGLVAGVAANMARKPDKERESIISAAAVQLAFLDSLPIKKSLASSSLKLSELKTGKTTVYLCLPASRMETHARWFRLVINLVLAMCERVKTTPSPPLMLMLDEFPLLGHMASLQAAAGQIAGYGVRLVTIVQDLTQLKREYPVSWETFLGNSGVSLYFGLADQTTVNYVAQELGVIGYEYDRMNNLTVNAQLAGGHLVDQVPSQSRLLEPHEVKRMLARDTDRALVLYSDLPPLMVMRARYYEDPGLKGLL